jgi:hypothetical protein
MGENLIRASQGGEKGPLPRGGKIIQPGPDFLPFFFALPSRLLQCQRRGVPPEVAEAAIAVAAGSQVVEDFSRVSRGWNQPMAQVFQTEAVDFHRLPTRLQSDHRKEALQDPLDMRDSRLI